MRIDKTTMFSDGQAITASADSTNTIDLTALGNFSTGDNIPVEVSVKKTMTNTTSGATLKIQALVSDKANFSGAGTKTIDLVSGLTVAKLKAGEVVYAGTLPKSTFQYIKLKYTASANFSAGEVNAFIPTTLS